MDHHIILVDVSHSMTVYLDNLSSNLNTFLTRIPRNSLVSVAWFSSEFGYICRAVSASDRPIISRFSFGRQACTSLYDSVAKIIAEWDPYDMMHSLYIISDGDDTISRVHTKKSVDALCTDAITGGKWTITHCSTETELLAAQHHVHVDMSDLEGMFMSLVV
jgi:hypothetical protein